VAYREAGVPIVWVADPNHRSVRVCLPDGVIGEIQEGGELDGGDVLPGFRLAVSDVFRSLDDD
jgi:Uma2 family endonuclease